MARICVALVEETTDGMVARMAELASVADLFEIRADRVIDLDLLTILRARTRPLVLTCRPVSQGGSWDDEDPRRRLTLLEAVKRGFDYVDVELRSGFMDVMVEKVGEGLIVSHHDIRGMPEDLDCRDELVEVHMQHPARHAPLLPRPAPTTNARSQRSRPRRGIGEVEGASGGCARAPGPAFP